MAHHPSRIARTPAVLTMNSPQHQHLLTRDRLQHHLVAAIADINSPVAVFKGGTLLRTCLFSEYRFSEDMDFDWIGKPAAFRNFISKAATLASGTSNIPLAVKEAVGKNVRIEWQDGNSRGEIKAEATFLTETSSMPPVAYHSVSQRWEGVPQGLKVKGYQPVSVASDKLKCLSRRSRCRDVYDLDKLIVNGLCLPKDAWDLYVRTWNDTEREYGWRPHPADIRSCYLGRKSHLEEEWEQVTASGLIEQNEPFESILYRVDKWVRHELENWKNSLPRGEIHRQKLANRKGQRT